MFLNYLYLCFILEKNKEKPKWNEIKQNNKKNTRNKGRTKKMIENFRIGNYGKKEEKKEMFISISSKSLK